jgi:hypothetical protein
VKQGAARRVGLRIGVAEGGEQLWIEPRMSRHVDAPLKDTE